MGFANAQRALHEPRECRHCGDGTYVLHKHEKVCPDCGYVSGTGDPDQDLGPWALWRKIRNQKHKDGKDRKRVVGSYVHAYPDYGRPNDN